MDTQSALNRAAAGNRDLVYISLQPNDDKDSYFSDPSLTGKAWLADFLFLLLFTLTAYSNNGTDAASASKVPPAQAEQREDASSVDSTTHLVKLRPESLPYIKTQGLA